MTKEFDELQLERERHRKTWRQLEHVTGLLWDVVYVFEGNHPAPGLVIARVRNTLSRQAEPDECFCHTGNASLMHPCPVHPVEVEMEVTQAEPAPAQDEREYPHEAMDKLAIERYRVGAACVGTLHRFAVQAGDGEQELYRGRESDCQNVARKLAGAFLDGGLALWNMIATRPAQTEQQPIRLPERKRTEHLPKEYKTMTVVRAGLEAYNRALDDVAALNAAPIAQTAPLDADTLAEIIRKVDGNHSLGAGVLAERIVAELSTTPSPAKRGDA